MPREKFMFNLGNIVIISILVPIACFLLYSLGTWWIVENMDLTMSRYNNNLLGVLAPMKESLPVKLPMPNILMLSALLTCSDMGVCLCVGGLSNRPNLATVIGGECGINPIVAIVLFAIMVSHMDDESFTASTPWIMLGQFCTQIVCIIIGAAYAFLTCLLFKHCRFISKSHICETIMMTLFGFLSYWTANGTIIWGVMMNPGLCIFIFFIIMGKYNWYNLSSEGKVTASAVYSFIGDAANAGCFSYIGIAVYTSIPGFWSWYFIGFLIPVVIVGRLIAVFLLFYIFCICFRVSRLNIKEVCYITWAGMVRGAVAFALAINIPYECQDSEGQCLD